jgi:hypothetical protein
MLAKTERELLFDTFYMQLECTDAKPDTPMFVFILSITCAWICIMILTYLKNIKIANYDTAGDL